MRLATPSLTLGSRLGDFSKFGSVSANATFVRYSGIITAAASADTTQAIATCAFLTRDGFNTTLGRLQHKTLKTLPCANVISTSSIYFVSSIFIESTPQWCKSDYQKASIIQQF